MNNDYIFKGFFWSFFERSFSFIILFALDVILSRLLLPETFGIYALLVIINSFANIFTDFGFSQALIRKKNLSEIDLSSVLILNLTISIFLYFLLFVLAPFFESFFNIYSMAIYIRVFAISIIINSIISIYKVQYIRLIDYKLISRISFISITISAILSLILAFFNFGIWTLIFQNLIAFVFSLIFILVYSKYKISFMFSFSSIRNIFLFGYKLGISSLIACVYTYIYQITIGKFFSISTLGFFNKAEKIKSIPAANLQTVISRIVYPVLSKSYNKSEDIYKRFRELFIPSIFISFILMISIFSFSKSFILVFFGNTWLPSLIYLRLLLFVALLLPIHVFNLNLLKAFGRSDIFLKLQIVKISLAFINILSGLIFGIDLMIILLFFISLFTLYLNAKWTEKLINYSSINQFKDVFILFVFSILISIPSILIDILSNNNLISLVLQISSIFFSFFVWGYILKFKPYLILIRIFRVYILKNR